MFFLIIHLWYKRSCYHLFIQSRLGTNFNQNCIATLLFHWLISLLSLSLDIFWIRHTTGINSFVIHLFLHWQFSLALGVGSSVSWLFPKLAMKRNTTAHRYVRRENLYTRRGACFHFFAAHTDLSVLFSWTYTQTCLSQSFLYMWKKGGNIICNADIHLGFEEKGVTQLTHESEQVHVNMCGSVICLYISVKTHDTG